MIQYIRDEGIELFEKPKIPEIEENVHPNSLKTLKKPIENIEQNNDSNQVTVKSDLTQSKRDFASDKEWLAYCDWLNKLSKEAVDHFLRGIQIGVQLNESYLVSQGSTYAWNYLHHIIKQRKQKQVIHILAEVLDALKKVGHNTEPDLLVAICVALAKGLMKPWLPEEQKKTLQMPAIADPNAAQGDKTKKDAKPNPVVGTTTKTFSIPPEASNDLKKALEVSFTYLMRLTL